MSLARHPFRPLYFTFSLSVPWSCILELQHGCFKYVAGKRVPTPTSLFRTHFLSPYSASLSFKFVTTKNKSTKVVERGVAGNTPFADIFCKLLLCNIELQVCSNKKLKVKKKKWLKGGCHLQHPLPHHILFLLPLNRSKPWQ